MALLSEMTRPSERALENQRRIIVTEAVAEIVGQQEQHGVELHTFETETYSFAAEIQQIQWKRWTEVSVLNDATLKRGQFYAPCESSQISSSNLSPSVEIL